jgi:DNA-binding transcriptional ArsR family regulator
MSNWKSMEIEQLAEEATLLHANICAALADPKRILILYALSEKNVNVSELAHIIGTSQPTASRHLKILREGGLVISERHGASVVYQLTDPRFIEALDILRSILRDRIRYQAKLIQQEI